MGTRYKIGTSGDKLFLDAALERKINLYLIELLNKANFQKSKSYILYRHLRHSLGSKAVKIICTVNSNSMYPGDLINNGGGQPTLNHKGL